MYFASETCKVEIVLSVAYKHEFLMAGIDVGHQFYSRAEMVVVGFHSHWLNGIDYMGQSYSKGVMHPSLIAR